LELTNGKYWPVICNGYFLLFVRPYCGTSVRAEEATCYCTLRYYTVLI
jgi:hypothetical protein